MQFDEVALYSQNILNGLLEWHGARLLGQRFKEVGYFDSILILEVSVPHRRWFNWYEKTVGILDLHVDAGFDLTAGPLPVNFIHLSRFYIY